MSISGSLSNALSGLTAAARSVEVVSSNVSNALTDGYGRRELELSSRSLGGRGAGVAINGVYRRVDEKVISERRLADAAMGQSSTAMGFLSDLEKALGSPEDPQSLTGVINQLETSLIESASRPDSQSRLNAVLSATKGLAAKFNQVSDRIQSLRLSADHEIANAVLQLNDGLQQAAKLNGAIRTQLAAGYDATALMDQRQQVIDKISQLVPLRQVDRGGGQIALFTPGGAILLDGKPASVGFTPVNLIVPQMKFGSSSLSGLTINGQAVSPGPDGPLAGGKLAGLFEVRDSQAVTAQARLDAVARDMIERFADPSVDPTLGATDPGLFTDGGAAFNSANEVGLAGRIAVNALVDPAAGGGVWRLRDGLGATTPGDVGNAAGLTALSNALTRAKTPPASGGFLGAARSASGLAGDLLSLNKADIRQADSAMSFATAQVDTLKALELQGGVDTDYEMQQLLLIEQAYSANARVVSTVDKLIQTLLGL